MKPSKNRAQICSAQEYFIAGVTIFPRTHFQGSGLMVQLARRSAHSVLVAGAGAMLVVTMSACKKGDASAAASTPVAGTITSMPRSADADHATNGAGLPAGYDAVFDRANAKPSDASYSEKEPGRWEVKTGPAHILYAAKDTASKKYSVTATFEQLEAPGHPEAYGIILGGSNLTDPAKIRYTYFLVRGNGQYAVKVRDGSATRTIADWTASPAVPRQDAAGKGLYGIRADVANGTAHVSVNGAPVATFTSKDGPLDGIAGARINHNLHVLVTPVSIVR
ncbi:MAG TPA: hypothetical protein VGT98_03490 [Candidatus Elarobacter sp.]|nr:hypothetical protein [Candidatus Elarobacter sp.]